MFPDHMYPPLVQQDYATFSALQNCRLANMQGTLSAPEYGSTEYWTARDRLEDTRNVERLEDWRIKVALGGYVRT